MHNELARHTEIQSPDTNSMMRSFDPDKRIESCDKSKAILPERKFDPDQRIDVGDRGHRDLYSTHEERIDRTPKNTGEWRGERGESSFIPNDSDAKAELEKRGLEGIEYRDGIVDFSPCAEATVTIDHMTNERLSYKDEDGNYIKGNYEQARDALAVQFNREAKDGRTDWTRNDVEQWGKDNGLTIHECNDMKTCQFVPTSIHKECKHLGGCSECGKRDGVRSGGEFDA